MSQILLEIFIKNRCEYMIRNREYDEECQRDALATTWPPLQWNQFSALSKKKKIDK
jgi:hypothetical protein